jgi:hypothetical protein
MRSKAWFGCLLVILIVGCTHNDPPRGAQAEGCNVTQPVRSPAPESTAGQPTDASVASWYSWYINADKSIWLLHLDQPLVARERYKIAWFRPAGADLNATGRRLDAPAPPMTVEITPPSYRHRFCPSIMIFPTEGCWEIVGTSGQSELRVVVKVAASPATTQPASP